MKFEFLTSPMTHKQCEIIVHCMVDFLGYSREEALVVINRTLYGTDQTDTGSFSHESEYYWAAAIHFHPANNKYEGAYREWYLDPQYDGYTSNFRDWFARNGYSKELEALMEQDKF